MSEEQVPQQAIQGLYLGYYSNDLLELAKKLKSENAATEAEMDFAEKINAIIEAAFLIAAADGELTDQEFDALLDSTKKLCQPSGDPFRSEFRELEEALSAMDINTSLQSFADLLDEQGYAKRIAYIADVLSSEGLRQQALMIAVDIAMQDGSVPDSENTVIHEMAKAFGFDAEKINKLLDAVDAARKKTS